MKAVWLVRSRQLNTRMRFWTAIVGYDPRDRSVTHLLYLIYVIVFFSIWGFAMLALIAEPVTWVLSFFKGYSPVQAAILLVTIILLTDVLWRGYRYARRSPFSFSEEDAVLVCMSPIDRRVVALAWWFGEWIPAGIPYWVGAATISFACLQMTTPAELVWVHLPAYSLMAIRAVSIVLPLHLTFMASSYAFGAYRLRADREVTNLRLVPLGIGVALLLLVLFSPASLHIILWPVQFTLAAGLGEANWLAGFALAIFMGIMSLMALFVVSDKLNLSRASQETSRSIRFQQRGITEAGPLTK